MMEGEFYAMTELYKTMPSLVPKPLTWDKFKLKEVDTYFFLCDFINMDIRLPDPTRLCSKIAELHRTSASPTGKFGFHISTCHGKFPQHVKWDSNWASFFTKLLKEALRLDIENNGPWPELEKVSERILTKVIPRLLGVLQENGREIKPCLIHGDLWEGNIGIAYNNHEIKIFDAGAYYAHNEMEIGMWRCVRHKINARAYTRQYLRTFPPSEPADEWDDRNRIYCVKMNMIHSAHHKGDIVRQTYVMYSDAFEEDTLADCQFRAYEDMCFLVDKYAPWDKDETDKIPE